MILSVTSNNLMPFIILSFSCNTVNYPKYSVFFKEQKAGFSTQIHRATLIQPYKDPVHL